MSTSWLSLLIIAPLVVGLAAWLWRSRSDRRNTDSSLGGSDFSSYAATDWGGSTNCDSDAGCGTDGGGDGGGCGGD